MLPQFQMYPLPMHPTPSRHYHPRSGFAPQESSLNHLDAAYGPSSVFSFPIRTLHHAEPIPTNTSEYCLRRKTPKGTIDAAYDASPLRPTEGPPPYKQMTIEQTSLLPSFPLNAPLLHSKGTAATSSIGQVLSTGSFNAQAATWPWNRPQEVPRGLDTGSYPQTWNRPLTMFDGASYPIVQPVIRANEYNVRAFCPPPPPPAALLPFGQLEFPANHWQGDNLFSTPHGNVMSLTCAPSALTFPPPADFASPIPDPWPGQPLALTNASPYSSRPDIDNRLGYNAQASHPGMLLPQPGFRDKVLAHAHAHYVELLSFTQTSRKVPHTKNGQSSREHACLFLYPKPPNPLQQSPSDAVMVSKKASYSPPRGATGQSELAFGNSSMTGHVASQVSAFGSTARGLSINYENERPPSNLNWGCEPSSVLTGRHDGTPIHRASSSLDILTNLCEQSGWKWIEGMLLGGCLLYGLQRYNEALKWFSRVLALDQRHVESLANAAATLYCLDRQQEAEQYWLRAVRTRPSYLEAAEHLVGLLYRKRSKDAIEVVTYVQDALRVTRTKTQREDQDVSPFTSMGSHTVQQYLSTSTPSNSIISDDDQVNSNTQGFGSSGYAVPGRENGRILALVHAKATMLYGMKSINAAAEAFEEAVLISVGRKMRDVHHLVRYIHAVLIPSQEFHNSQQIGFKNVVQPLLLTPDKARQTARLAFSGSGDLPGLKFVVAGSSKRAATQTTSNSLLSLAKIFQDTISHGGATPQLLRCPPSIGDILALYYLSLSLQESPSTANNVGILLAGVQPELSTPVSQSAGNLSHPLVPGVAPGSGLALALAYYQYGLRLDPKHVHLHTNLGSLLKDIGQLDLAIQMYEQAVLCDSTFDIALTNLANAVKDRGRIQDAIMYYKRAVQSNPDFAEAVCGLFTALNSVCDWRGRGGAIMPNRNHDRWHVDDAGTLIDAQSQLQASGLTKRVTDIVESQLQEASRWGLHTLQDETVNELVGQLRDVFDGNQADLARALRQWAGKPWEGSRIVRLIERASRVLQRRYFHDQYQTPQHHESGWGDHKSGKVKYRRPRLPASLTIPPAPTVLPFHTFTCPLTATEVRAISQRNAIRISCSTMRSSWLPDLIYPPPPPPNPHLNIGYISSDFNNHPLAHLMQSVFGFHDPHRVQAYCYATTASDGSSHRLKIEKEAPVFRDVSSWSPSRLAEQVNKDNIHVLVNLNGYTRGARNEIFAARPAPIQMSFMGFAGSLGAEWCDYLLADGVAIPEATLRPWRANTKMSDVLTDESESRGGDWIYSENIIFCRDTFFCCDHAQSADEGERSITWAAEQARRWAMRRKLFPSLDDDTIILGNFNQLYKIEPTTFRTWLRILDKVPKAVLWLLRFPELGEQHLRSTAKAWAGEEVAKRLIFTDVAPKSQHISRARVCDLFLDTPECNAHTTAADVLWSSTPLLTLPRYPYKMCSRMAASILRGALPKNSEGDKAAKDLIASSEEDYEASAVLLAGGLVYDVSTGVGLARGRLADLRKLLWDSKWTCGLFDTRRWVADVETAYEEAWRHWVSGESGDIFL